MNIQESKNYELFEMSDFNRDVLSTKKLEASFKRHGWIDAYPLHVSKKIHGGYTIKAGHHRASVARRLGVPFKFVVCDDDAQIHEMETATRRWTIHDYLNSWARTGNENYIAIKEYCARTGIAVGLSFSMHGGHLASSHNLDYQFKSGTFKVRDKKHPEDVASIVLLAKRLGLNDFNNSSFVSALSMVLFAEGFDKESFRKRLIKNKSLFSKKQTRSEALTMIESIYNRGSQDKLPIAFLATEAARLRNVVNRGIVKK